MGGGWNGRFVSGIAISAVCATTSAPPPPPLTADLDWNGQSPLPVSSASGVAQTVTVSGTYYPNVFVYIVSGGVQPYLDTHGMRVTSNPSGKLYLANHSDGVHTTVGWSNLTIGEVESLEIAITTTDSAGTSFVNSASVSVQRIS